MAGVSADQSSIVNRRIPASMVSIFPRGKILSYNPIAYKGGADG
jgi:hypothetical protein